eukprot:173027_1
MKCFTYTAMATPNPNPGPNMSSVLPRQSELIVYGYMRQHNTIIFPMEIVDLLHYFYDALCFNYGDTIYSDWLKRQQTRALSTEEKVNIDIQYIANTIYDESEHKVHKSCINGWCPSVFVPSPIPSPLSPNSLTV